MVKVDRDLLAADRFNGSVHAPAASGGFKGWHGVAFATPGIYFASPVATPFYFQLKYQF